MSRMQWSGGKPLATLEQRPAPSVSRGKSGITRLVESMAQNAPVIEPKLADQFRDKLRLIAEQMPDCSQESEQLPLIENLIREMEDYRGRFEIELKRKDRSWQELALMLFREVLSSRGIHIQSPGAAQLAGQITNLATSEAVEDFHDQAHGFLRTHKSQAGSIQLAAPGALGESLANDNAAGLRGAGLAVAHLQQIIDKAGSGFVAQIRLNCLDMIQERFGDEAVADCMMAVSAFVTSSLKRDDAVYHWSDTSLMAILQGRANEKILAAELQHISSINRDITLNVQGRTILLRVPLIFDLTEIKSLAAATDLYRIAVPDEEAA